MLTRRTVRLNGAQLTEAEPLLRRELIEQHREAESIIETARLQAEALLDEARCQADALAREAREAATAEFWQRAEAFFEDWREQQARMTEGLVDSACQLVSQALTTLLDEVPDEARIRALLRQLRTAQADGAGGELYCHPQARPAAEAWLSERSTCDWRIREDESLDVGSVRLVAEHGDFLLNWGDAVTALLPRYS
ncbi:type III secretion system stator protein SctL [Pseudomonas indica]|uniref:type III secretion system stator protein SctL n=1 Tax=Pseudomonas indica TaxID=137658 RepID=UPI0023FA074E|nr:type III secretion system stator protein SctL [Pseudomonas indica]MBU3057504.1 type III secretion system stator protein SctL [Pseudomonas indica]